MPEDWDRLRKKAEDNFEMAEHLLKDHPNAAANRLYYALYQLLKARYKLERLNPSQLVYHSRYTKKTKQDDDKDDYYRHEVVGWWDNLRKIGHDRRRKLVRECFSARKVADYFPRDVDRDALEGIFGQVRAMVADLLVELETDANKPSER